MSTCGKGLNIFLACLFRHKTNLQQMTLPDTSQYSILDFDTIMHLFSSPIRRNRGAYVITLALAYALPAWSNLCVQGLFFDTVYAVALKLHTLIQGH